MDTAELYQLIDELVDATQKESIEEICHKFCNLTGIEYFLMGVVSNQSLYSPELCVLTNYPSEWMDLYLKKNKRDSDPVVKYTLSKNTPIFWNDLSHHLVSLSIEQKLLMAQAKSHGLVTGVSIPIHSVSGYFSVFSLATKRDGEEGKRILEAALPYAHIFATHLFERYLMVLTEPLVEKTNISLTRREEECLFWACEGKTSWEISQILEIKERTVVFHLNNASEKLGAINRQHAVVLAMKKGLVQPNI
ncbi:LuxR family transcriptional regulator [Vibrio sp. TRT 21S02]|uniref:LuxR family transcriptional regulator n=1 Tax=Vibrio sp. TRT 21S02 TaxID=3418507 RepID=UPI003CF089CA